MFKIGIDLGGTKIEGIVMDAEPQALERIRVATPAGDYAATLRTITGLVGALEQACGVADLPVGIGHPGSLSPHSGLIRNANSTCLNNRSLQQDLQQLLQRPLRMANDANCLALSELSDGAAAGARSSFSVILGTGVGGAIAIGSRVLFGHNGIAGEWSHNPLPWPEADETHPAACWCGLSGCIETWLSGPALAADHARHCGAVGIDAEQIGAAAMAGDVTAIATLDRYSTRLARSLAWVINMLDPEVIVLAGGVSRIGSLYREVPQRWMRWIFADHVETRLVPAAHGDSSGVRGAAMLWDQARPCLDAVAH